jgi:hypothetical protein
VQAQRLDDLVADGVHRAEGGHRLLGDERDLGAADGAHGGTPRIQPGQVHDLAAVAAKQHAAADHATGRLDDLQHRPHGHALAAAALAHDADDLPRRHLERHAIHRAHEALVEAEVHAEVVDGENRLHQRP